MSSYRIRSGSCTGRGFAKSQPEGFLAQLHTWLTDSTGDVGTPGGGAGWTLLEDHSQLTPTLTDDPWIIASNHSSVDGTSRSKIARFLLDVSEPARVNVAYFLNWELGPKAVGSLTAMAKGAGGLNDGDTFTLDDAYNGPLTFEFDDNGSVNGSNISIDIAAISTDIEIASAMESTINATSLIFDIVRAGALLTLTRQQPARTGTEGDIAITESVAGAGTLSPTGMSGGGVSSGYGQWMRTFVDTLDSAAFSFDFRGGDQALTVQSRIGSSWSTSMFDEWVDTGDVFVEAQDIRGSIDSPQSPGSDVVIPMQADSSSATFVADRFSIGKSYYIYDYVGTSKVNYVKVIDKNNPGGGVPLGSVKVEELTRDFKTESVLCSYDHRFYAGHTVTAQYFNQQRCQVPYYSRIGYEQQLPETSSNASISSSTMDTALLTMDPDDESKFAVQRPLLCEGRSYDNVNLNRSYGLTRNSFNTAKGSMAQGLDGKIIAGQNWLYFHGGDLLGGDYHLAVMVPDFQYDGELPV